MTSETAPAASSKPGRVTDAAGTLVSRVARHRVAGPAVIVAGVAACCTAVLLGDPTTPGGPLPVCPTKALAGIDCPGCGALRAIYSLLHADVLAALRYNAVAVVAIGLLGWAFVAYCVGLWRGRRVRSWQHLRYAPVVTAVVVMTWFVIRNIPVEPFASLRV
ncbi:DUF2752 domain-containing protein [Gordonia sinesedis]